MEVVVTDRLVSVDSVTNRLPSGVRQRLATDLADPSTESGAVLSTTIGDALVADRPRQDGKFATKFQFNVRDFGAKLDGTTDDTAAINATIDALVSGAFNTSAVLLFPVGVCISRGGHVIPTSKRVTIVGGGAYNSIIYKLAGSPAVDMFTINSPQSTIRDLTIDGNRVSSAVGVGHGLVLNASLITVDSVSIYNAAGCGLLIGNTAVASIVRLSKVLISESAQYGVYVTGNFGSYDGYWSQVEIGRSGLSGFKIQSGSQILVGVHSWGNGWAGGTSDGDGGYLASGGHHLVGCEFETNFNAGLRIAGGTPSNINIVGSGFWGNGGRGLYTFGTSHAVVSGNKFFRNGVNSVSTSLSSGTAALVIDGCTNWTVTGNDFTDDTTAIPALSYAVAPAFPFMGRTGKITQSCHIVELNGSDGNTFTGNTMRGEETSSGTPVVLTGATNVFSNNQTGSYVVPAVVAASTITLPVTTPIVKIAGATAIQTITPGRVGATVTLVFTSATPGGFPSPTNITLRGSFTPTTGAAITLMYDGAKWLEVSRSA